jgi:hypothetical protein
MLGGIKERIAVSVRAIGPMGAFEVVPQVLDGIEFREISRQ